MTKIDSKTRKDEFLLLVQTYAIAAQVQRAVLVLSPDHHDYSIPEPTDAMVVVHEAMRVVPGAIPPNVLDAAAGFVNWQVHRLDRPAWVEYLPTE